MYPNRFEKHFNYEKPMFKKRRLVVYNVISSILRNNKIIFYQGEERTFS